MCVKLPPEDLNPDPYPPHPTSIYTCVVSIAPRVCGGNAQVHLKCDTERESSFKFADFSTTCPTSSFNKQSQNVSWTHVVQ